MRNVANHTRWASFSNSELLPPIMDWINPIIGKKPSSPEILAAAEKSCEKVISVIEGAIAGKKYLVSNTLTIADLFVISALARGYQFVFAKKWAADHGAIHEYYMRIRGDEIFCKIDGKPYLLAEVGAKHT